MAAKTAREDMLLAALRADRSDGALSKEALTQAVELAKDVIETRIRERNLIRAAERVFEALRRCIRWAGTGATMQERAYTARDKALEEWRTLTSEKSA